MGTSQSILRFPKNRNGTAGNIPPHGGAELICFSPVSRQKIVSHAGHFTFLLFSLLILTIISGFALTVIYGWLQRVVGPDSS